MASATTRAIALAPNRNNIVVTQGSRTESAVVVNNQVVSLATPPSTSLSATSRNNIITTQGSRTESAVVIKKLDGTLTVQGLSNVDSANLQDGYTIIYDAETNTWVTQEVVATAVANLDGGYY